jgi:transcriptional regulator with XRE-family HTH domain
MPRKSTAKKLPALPTPAAYAAARQALGHSQASLADAIGMSLRTIKHRESAKGNVTREMMLALQAVPPRTS